MKNNDAPVRLTSVGYRRRDGVLCANESAKSGFCCQHLSRRRYEGNCRRQQCARFNTSDINTAHAIVACKRSIGYWPRFLNESVLATAALGEGRAAIKTAHEE